MINYQYYHTGRGYEGKINLEPNNIKYNYYNSAFDKYKVGSITQSVTGNAFIYICNDNEWMMYKSVDNKGAVRGEGFAGELSALKEQPYKYIDKLSLSEHDGSDIPANVSLPKVDADGGYQFPSKLASTVIRIIDVLFNGNFLSRPQIRINAKKETGIEILKALSALLPENYMKRIGFCIGSNNISGNVYYFYDAGRPVELSFKMVISEFSESECESMATWTYFFDTVKGKDNWDDESLLSTYLARSKSLNIAKWRSVFDDVVKKDGTIDSGKLDIYVAEDAFNAEISKKNAKTVLEKTKEHVSAYETLIIRAINAMLSQSDNDACNEDEIALINNIRNSNRRISAETDAGYVVYLIKAFAGLGEEGMAALKKLLLRDKDGVGIKMLLKSVDRNNPKADREAYEFLCELLKNANEENHRIYDSWSPLIIEYLNIQKRYKTLAPEDRYSGEFFFTYLNEINDDEIVNYLISLLMASAYEKNCTADCKRTRIVGLKGYLDSKYDDRDYKSGEKLRKLIMIRTKIIGVCKMSHLEIGNISEFVFDSADGKSWLVNTVESLSFVEKLQLANNIETHDYTSLYSVLKKSLLDEEVVFHNVKSASQLGGAERIEVQYGAFFEGLTAKEKESHGNIRTYLNTLTTETAQSEKIRKYRSSFIKGFYNTLPKKTREGIGDEYGNNNSQNIDVLFDGLPLDRQTKLAELMNKEFSAGELCREKRQSGFEILSVITTVGWILAALVMLLLPTLAQCIALELDIGADYLTRFKEFFSFAYLLFPIGAVAANLLSYLKIKKKKHKRACMITLWCCIIPEFVFVASYIVFYLMSVNF